MEPNYDRLLAMIYHGTDYIVGFHNMEKEVKSIMRVWYAEIGNEHPHWKEWQRRQESGDTACR